MSLAVLGRRGDVVLTTVFFTAALVTVLTAAVALGLRVLVLRALGAADTVIKMNQRVMSESKWQMSGLVCCSVKAELDLRDAICLSLLYDNKKRPRVGS